MVAANVVVPIMIKIKLDFLQPHAYLFNALAFCIQAKANASKINKSKALIKKSNMTLSVYHSL